MNTRLQVEHPVTELITGKDLVKEQILIAEGRALSFAQEDLKIQGHAVEVRVYAEDPKNNFLPDIGMLHVYKRPQGPGVRVDDGFEEGMEIPIYYDPIIGKLITYHDTREGAIQRMIRAIDEFQIIGVETTLAFCRFVMQHQAFRVGKFDTKFIERYFSPEMLEIAFSKEETAILAAMGAFLYEENKTNRAGATLPTAAVVPSQWKNRLKS